MWEWVRRWSCAPDAADKQPFVTFSQPGQLCLAVCLYSLILMYNLTNDLTNVISFKWIKSLCLPQARIYHEKTMSQLFHAFILNKKILSFKPKITMCVSLHYNGKQKRAVHYLIWNPICLIADILACSPRAFLMHKFKTDKYFCWLCARAW